MKTYNISLRTPQRLWDSFSMDFRTPDVLRHEITRFFGELLHDRPLDFWSEGKWWIEVEEAGGGIAWSLGLIAGETANEPFSVPPKLAGACDRRPPRRAAAA